ncbi:hypothetical protein [Butyrivibrio sp. NC2007]|uniref:hypothetical protein n=1 Tax=Butyrivibrio sp. NC2007 TaxID=1280683 RepID=UPI0012DF1C46|nr:hypothetical protein [Butyrivibrio sp. NC2007]
MQDVQRSAIYHFSNSTIRQYICENELNRIADYACSKGFTNPEIYCDIRTDRYQHSQFDKLMSSYDRYQAIFVKDYTHINKYTTKMINSISNLYSKGIPIYSTEEDQITLHTQYETSAKPRVATYYCHWSRKEDDIDQGIKHDVLRHFAIHKIGAITVDQYADECLKGHAGNQPQLKLLINHADDYDIVLVQTFASIHWRTDNFCHFRRELSLDIFSITEGFLPYPRNTPEPLRLN